MEQTTHPSTLIEGIYERETEKLTANMFNISNSIYLGQYYRDYASKHLKKMPVFLRNICNGIYHWGQKHYSCSFASLLNAYQCKNIEDFCARVIPDIPKFTIKEWIANCFSKEGTSIDLLVDNFGTGNKFVIQQEQDVYNIEIPNRAIIYEDKHFYAFIKQHDKLIIIDSIKSYIEENHSSNRNINAFAREYFVNKINNKKGEGFIIIELK
jgi:hypothetical protein